MRDLDKARAAWVKADRAADYAYAKARAALQKYLDVARERHGLKAGQMVDVRGPRRRWRAAAVVDVRMEAGELVLQVKPLWRRAHMSVRLEGFPRAWFHTLEVKHGK